MPTNRESIKFALNCLQKEHNFIWGVLSYFSFSYYPFFYRMVPGPQKSDSGSSTMTLVACNKFPPPISHSSYHQSMELFNLLRVLVRLLLLAPRLAKLNGGWVAWTESLGGLQIGDSVSVSRLFVCLRRTEQIVEGK